MSMKAKSKTIFFESKQQEKLLDFETELVANDLV
jgi:hypothetical protein